MASGMKCARLNSGHAETELSSGFSARKPMEFAKKNYASKAFPEASNRLDYSCATLAFDCGLLRRWPLIGGIKGQSRLRVVIAGFADWGRRPSPPEHHQRFIDSDASHPG